MAPLSSKKAPSEGTRRVVSLVYSAMIITLSLATVITTWPAREQVPGWASGLGVELRYMLLVVTGAALCTALRAIQTVAGTLGKRKLDEQWLWEPLLRFLSALPVSLIGYMALRAILFAPTLRPVDLNPFGILVFGFGMGLVSEQAFVRVTSLSFFAANPVMEERFGRIADALGATTLDNYSGALCVELRDARGRSVPLGEESLAVLRGNHRYDLRAWFQPTAPSEGTAQGGTDRERERRRACRVRGNARHRRRRPIQPATADSVGRLG